MSGRPKDLCLCKEEQALVEMKYYVQPILYEMFPESIDRIQWSLNSFNI